MVLQSEVSKYVLTSKVLILFSKTKVGMECSNSIIVNTIKSKRDNTCETLPKWGVETNTGVKKIALGPER